MEEHGLPHGHVGGEGVVLADVGDAVLQPRRSDAHPVDEDVAVELHRPRVVRVGEDVAERGALVRCGGKMGVELMAVFGFTFKKMRLKCADASPRKHD